MESFVPLFMKSGAGLFYWGWRMFNPHFMKSGLDVGAAVKKGGFRTPKKGVFWGTKRGFLGVRKGGF
jgi:hypothetical protein